MTSPTNSAYTNLLPALKVAEGAINGAWAVSSLFYVCNFPNQIIEQVTQLAQGNFSTQSLSNLGFTAYGLYSIKNTVKSLFSGDYRTASVIAGIFSGLIVGTWNLEKASTAALITGAIVGGSGMLRELYKKKPPSMLDRINATRKQ